MNFEQAQTPQLRLQYANELFATLHQQQFIDTLIVYNDATPADTIREQVWYWCAEYFYDQQQYELAEKYAQKALPLYQVSNDRTGEADCLNLLSISNIRLSHYQRAAGYAQQCYLLDQASGDTDRIVTSLNSLAAIYISARQPDEAEQYVLKGLEMATETDNLPRRAVLLGTASETYHALGNDERALQYAEEAYAIECQLGRQQKAMVRLSQKASALIGMHRYEEARTTLQLALPYFIRQGDQQSLGISCNKMGMALHALGHDDEAKNYYRQAADIFVNIGDKNNEMHARKGLYESLWHHAPDSAMIELERFNELKDLLYNDASAESLARFDAEFGNDWLRQENEAQRVAKRHIMKIAIIVVVLLLLFTAVVWWLMRRRQRRQHSINQQLSANIEELRKKYKELSVRYDNALITTPGSRMAEGSEQLTPADSQFLEQVVDIINEQMYSGQADAETLASRMNMSLFQLRQRLTTLTGETPQNFISLVRMRRARYLLDNRPELNISEVAQLCAYNDTPNFSRAFKKVFNITPTQYVEKQRKAV
jgi:AraC-like DNA-binding protein/tetratricopeptide (TPR) repeat protein